MMLQYAHASGTITHIDQMKLCIVRKSDIFFLENLVLRTHALFEKRETNGECVCFLIYELKIPKNTKTSSIANVILTYLKH